MGLLQQRRVRRHLDLELAPDFADRSVDRGCLPVQVRPQLGRAAGKFPRHVEAAEIRRIEHVLDVFLLLAGTEHDHVIQALAAEKRAGHESAQRKRAPQLIDISRRHGTDENA